MLRIVCWHKILAALRVSWFGADTCASGYWKLAPQRTTWKGVGRCNANRAAPTHQGNGFPGSLGHYHRPGIGIGGANTGPAHIFVPKSEFPTDPSPTPHSGVRVTCLTNGLPGGNFEVSLHPRIGSSIEATNRDSFYWVKIQVKVPSSYVVNRVAPFRFNRKCKSPMQDQDSGQGCA